MNRRKILKTIFGSIAGTVLAPVIKVMPPVVTNRLPGMMIPMIRRTFPELLTKELVDVQPMSEPGGLAFALRYVYIPKKYSFEWFKQKFIKYKR